jgi:SAM-dependent methyltransferase
MSKSPPAQAGTLTFACNVCGKVNTCPSDQIGRETASCSSCRSTVRMRSIVHTLSQELYGRCMPIDEFPKEPRYKGIGTSDWNGYASRLAKRLDYTNTYYHKAPQVDITAPDPSMNGTLDFVTSTDVFEHIVPPVGIAFEAVRRLLKPTGVFAFSVPYKLDGKTTEHFPDMHEWDIDRSGAKPVLHNQAKDGTKQVFDDLVFHGGEGATLEMRVFSLESLIEHAKAAGFRPPRIYHSSHMQCGTVWEVDWSLTMALRPAL